MFCPRLAIALALSLGIAPSLAIGKPYDSPTTSEMKDPRLPLLDAMTEELTRNQNRLHLPSYDLPYYISYAMTETEEHTVYGKSGALFDARGGKRRVLYVEVRVGDYALDNTNIGSFDFDPNMVSSPYVSVSAPEDNHTEALKHGLWLLTDETYKEALSASLRKRGKEVFSIEEESPLNSFSKESSVQFIQGETPFHFDKEKWSKQARDLSAQYNGHAEIFDGDVSISGRKVTRYYVNTEGSRLLQEKVLYSFSATATTRADDGMLLDNSFTHYFSEESTLPSNDEMASMLQAMIKQLLQLRQAPILEPYTGPAILAPEATGVFFHESIGHRLEGERQNRDEEGQTFKEQVGKVILPSFINIYDDPTLEFYEETALNGYYHYDDEAVKAQRVNLVENGVLTSFILSRTPIEGFEGSNGHGRSAGMYDPIARMGNFVVASSQTVPDAELKKMLMEEATRQGKPYGLYIHSIEGGNTNTSAYGYQAFKGEPRLVYKIDAATGEETLVRGVEMVGTPLTVIGKLITTGETSEVFNGYCGAESGYVPVSTIAPAVLLEEVELQRSLNEPARLPILPPPGLDTEEKSTPETPKRRRLLKK